MKRLAVALCISIALMFLVVVISPPVLAGHGANVWTVPGDFATIQQAINSANVLPGDTIRVGPGNFAGAELNKGVHIKGKGQTIIDSGPLAGDPGEFGFLLVAGSDGASISHLTFDVGLGIYAKWADDVTVEQCRFNNNVQAITNWGGSGWKIHHNTITNVLNFPVFNDDGDLVEVKGGTPIVIGGREDGAGAARNNVLTHNSITGQVLFYADETEGNNDGDIFGILVAAIPGAEGISGNQIAHNKVKLVSNQPDLRQVAALGLMDWSSSDNSCTIIFDNIITLNDFRATDRKIDLYPAELADCNQITKNK